MAEVTGMRNNILPYPIYGLPYTFVFPLLDADGDLVTGGTSDTPDTELSKNGDTFTDCTEAVEIATASGMYYVSLTAAEMTCNVGSIIMKTATAGTKTTPIVFYPRELPKIRSATAQAGANTTITLDASAKAIDDYYNGCVIYVYGGTGAGQVRIITDYVGSTKVATVNTWATNPSSDSTFYIYITESSNVPRVYDNESKIDIIDTVVDGIQTDLSNATDGLGALKSLIDATQSDITTIAGYTDLIDDATNGLVAIKAEVEGLGGDAMRGTDNAALATALATHDSKLDTVDTVVDGIQSDLSNATDGLGALKALVDAAQSDITTIAGYTDLIDDATNGLAAIKAEVEGLGGAEMRGTDGAALASAWTAALATILANFTAVRIGYLDQLDFNLQEAIAALPTASEIQTEIEENGASLLDTIRDALANATYGLEALKALIDTAQGTITKLDDTLEDDGGTYRFTENALEEAPSGTGGDATAANQTTIIDAIADVQADLDNPDQYKGPKSVEL